MTITDSRWWAPAEPGIGPDEFDLELLEPGEDPVADLGQAFLALHRVGAAACEAVATQPLADEDALAFALANARKLVAPEASQIVSKAVGDNVNYGNLLIRDVLDDAEATALSLWRSCIAKSVPASTTAKRVGMVYGLPPGELFAFQKLATDPKANPVALQEAADKALFTHVSKLVKDEAVERKVEISKQRPPRAARARWWDEEPRDASGEWAAETTAGDAEPVEVEPTPALRGRRGARGKRGIRPQRPETRREVARGQAARGEAARGQAARIDANREVADKILALLAKMPDKPSHGPTNRAREVRPTPDATKPYDAPEHGEYVDKQLSFVLPSDEWQAFMQGAAPSELGKMFYAGRLQEYIGLPTVYKEDDDLTTFDHEQMVKQVADKIRESDDFKAQPKPQTLRIAVDQDTNEAEVDTTIKKWMIHELGVSEDQFNREEAHVEVFADVADPKKAMYAVYTPKPRNRPRDADRPLPQLTEVVVADEDLFGDYQERGGKGQYRIDRGQMLTTSGVFARKDVVGRRFWDQDNQVVRNVVYTHVTDETVQKALSPDRFHALEEQGRIHRDATGEFAAAEETAPVEAPVPTRGRRGQRGKRGVRQQLVPRPVEREAASREMAARLDAERSEAVRQAFAEAPPTKQPTSNPGDDFTLADSHQYSALPHWLMISTLGHPVHPGRETRLKIAEAGPGNAEETEQEAIRQHGLQHLVKGQARREERVANYRAVHVEDLEDVAHRIHALMQKKPKGEPFFTLARVKMRLNKDDTADIEVFRNTDQLAPRDVIRWEDTSDAYNPYTLYPERSGRFYTPAMIRQWLHGSWASAEKTGKETGRFEDDDYLANPWVRVWSVEPDTVLRGND